MRMLRTLESLGAAVMREGAYLLPDTAGSRQGARAPGGLHRQGRGRRAGAAGRAAVGRRAAQCVSRLFDRSCALRRADQERRKPQRRLRHRRPERDCARAAQAAPRARGHRRARFLSRPRCRDAPRDALRDGRGRGAQAAVSRAGAGRAGSPDEPLLRRVWATRRPPWADRLACAWLIRRFVDPEGSVLWLDKAQACPAGRGRLRIRRRALRQQRRARHLRSQMLTALRPGEERGARQDRRASCTSSKCASTPVPEAAGVQTLLQGAARRSASDDELLRRSGEDLRPAVRGLLRGAARSDARLERLPAFLQFLRMLGAQFLQPRVDHRQFVEVAVAGAPARAAIARSPPAGCPAARRPRPAPGAAAGACPARRRPARALRAAWLRAGTGAAARRAPPAPRRGARGCCSASRVA